MFTLRSALMPRLAYFKRVLRAASIATYPKCRHPQIVVESKVLADIDVPKQPVVDFVWKDMCVWEDKPFMTCAATGDTLLFGEARRQIHAFARYFSGIMGLQKGEVLALIGSNAPIYAVVAQGALEAGLVVSFVSPVFTNDELIEQLRKANVSVVLAEPAILQTLRPAIEGKLPNVRKILPLDNNLKSCARLAANTEGITLPRIEPEDLAILPFSSGTTGLPKGVMLTNANITSNLSMLCHPAFRYSRPTVGDVQDKCFNLLPLYHIYGINAVLHFSIVTGQHLITIPKFTPDAFISTLRKYRPHGLALVPPIIHMMVAHPGVTRDDLSSINFIITGAASCPRSSMEALQEKAGHPIDIREGYGLTETSPACFFNPKHRSVEHLGSVGILLPGIRGRVLDTADGKDLGPNKNGEILVKGPHVMRGYLDNEAATKDMIDSDGWLHTGDIGYYDQHEFFYITGRTKELIKVKGLQVSPTELEAILMELPEVADAAVIGIPDDKSGELPLAFVALKPGKTVDTDKVISHVKPRVAPYKQLAGGVRILAQIPRSPAGKILRAQLRQYV